MICTGMALLMARLIADDKLRTVDSTPTRGLLSYPSFGEVGAVPDFGIFFSCPH